MASKIANFAHNGTYVHPGPVMRVIYGRRKNPSSEYGYVAENPAEWDSCLSSKEFHDFEEECQCFPSDDLNAAKEWKRRKIEDHWFHPESESNLTKNGKVCINLNHNLSVRKTRALIKLVKKMGNLERAHLVYNYSEDVIIGDDFLTVDVKEKIPVKEMIEDLVKKFDIHSCKNLYIIFDGFQSNFAAYLGAKGFSRISKRISHLSISTDSVFGYLSSRHLYKDIAVNPSVRSFDFRAGGSDSMKGLIRAIGLNQVLESVTFNCEGSDLHGVFKYIYKKWDNNVKSVTIRLEQLQWGESSDILRKITALNLEQHIKENMSNPTGGGPLDLKFDMSMAAAFSTFTLFDLGLDEVIHLSIQRKETLLERAKKLLNLDVEWMDQGIKEVLLEFEGSLDVYRFLVSER